MRSSIAILTAAAVLAALPALAQQPRVPYKIVFDPERDIRLSREGPGNTLYVKGHFTIVQEGEATGNLHKDYKIFIKENGHKVKEADVPQPKPSDDLSVMLTMDIGARMGKFGRMDRARDAAKVFFTNLPKRADCGLILFNQNPRVHVSTPGKKSRDELLGQVAKTQPKGGTRYLDATVEAINALLGTKTRGKAVVLMTDGVDLGSHADLNFVVNLAKQKNVKVFTIGIGEPGKNDAMTTVLALDKSGSMLEPAVKGDKKLKIDALKEAALSFLDMMRSNARATLLEFNDQVRIPDAFSADKALLRKELEKRISQQTASGETAFIDAAYTAVATLMAENPSGAKTVVVLTDGVDNSSRRRKEEVIALAKSAGIKIYMLGLGRRAEKGRPSELDEVTMEAIAKETGGEYHHAGNQKELLALFEKLSIQLHDDGINEASLKALANQTGGKYYPVRDSGKLQFVLDEVSQSVQQKDYPIDFPSIFQNDDGTVRHITLELVRLGGAPGTTGGGVPEVVQQAVGQTQVRGVVVAEMNYLVYLAILGVLGVLLAVPPAMRRLTRGAPGEN